ncbi:MAG: phosphoglucomutase/phosphomannomutase family protein [Candidatus Ratteibacteria bacterium]|nr:phosphoglucomutase/phosphomannomutase family protein [Candidatus Ratteibacteria bacterium]
MNETPKIKFGTDGWRAVVNEDCSLSNIKCIAQAIADYFKKGKIIVGFDTRNLSPEFASAAAAVLSSNGFSVILSKDYVPTPVLSYKIKAEKAEAGIMITASHNPAKYNGLKIKGSFAGPVNEQVTNQIEILLDKNPVKETEDSKNRIITEDFSSEYLAGVKKYIKQEFLKESRFKVVIDGMYGAGGDYLPRALEETPVEIKMIRNQRDISFGGIRPEPIAENLRALTEKVKEEKAALGLATDGDADRLGIVDAAGNYINAQLVFSMLLLHLLESRPWRGGLVKSIACSFLLDKIGRKFQLPIYETAIGFKYAVQYMLDQDILMAGEESGGYGFKGRPPERDGILAGLLLLEMMGRRRQSLGEILKYLEKEFGPSFYQRVDVPCSPIKKEEYLKKLRDSLPKSLGRKKVKNVNSKDGYKFILEDESWLLMRFSGTEPLLRIYTEAKSLEDVQQLLLEGKRMAGVEF